MMHDWPGGMLALAVGCCFTLENILLVIEKLLNFM